MPFTTPTASVASSETSETPSISDEPNSNTTNAIKKIVKKQKEMEKERPPWRPVSIAAPSKADKNALLKAKILDATRRAMISQRLCSYGTQTDPISTVIMKDAEINVQDDLIIMTDQSVETDGAISIKKDLDGGFLLTQTVGQMTEGVLLVDFSTQTARPKTSINFSNLFTSNHDEESQVNGQPQNLSNIDLILQENEQRLKFQIKELEHLDANIKQYEKISTEDESMSDDSLTFENEKPHHPDHFSFYTENKKNIDELKEPPKGNFLREPTLTSWDDFDLSDEEDQDFLPKTKLSNYTSWKDYEDLVLGRRLANMTLSPVLPRPRSTKRKTVTWSDTQYKVVSNLIAEAAALIDLFDYVSLALGPNVNFNFPKEPKHTNSSDKKEELIVDLLPPSKWEPILANTCKTLEEQMKKFKKHKFKTFTPFDLSAKSG